MFQRPILMNDEGSSPGGGAPINAPASPAAQAGAAPAAPVVDVSVIKNAVTEAFGELRNGLFADLRKAGALKADKPTPPQPAPVNDAGQASAPSITQADFQNMLARERAVTRAVASAGLSDEQAAFVEETIRAVNPPDPGAWTQAFVATMGLGKKNATHSNPAQPESKPAPAAPPTPAPVPSGPSFSDKGPAASSAARDPLAIIQNDPRKATMDDYHRLVAEHGVAKATQMWTDHTMRFLSTVKVRPEGRR